MKKRIFYKEICNYCKNKEICNKDKICFISENSKLKILKCELYKKM